MNSPKTIIFKCIVYTLLISQVLLYMIVPGAQDKQNAGNASFDDYFIEQVLNIPNRTPYDESDDTERVMQLVQVETFHCNPSLPDPITFHVNSSTYHPEMGSEIASIAYDILVPPPLS